jgi:hypothetical protein
MILRPGAKDCLPVHDVAGAVDRPVGVDVGRPAATLPSTQRVAAGRDCSHIIARRGQHPEVVRRWLGRGHMQVDEPVGVGGPTGLLLPAEARAYLRAGDSRAGDAVDAIGQHAAARGARDHCHAANHEQRVSLEVAVRGFDQVEAGGQRVNRQLLRIGDVGWRQLLAPAGDQLVIVQ